MIELPEKFKENVVNRYGKKGEEWLKNINVIINKYIKKFNLYDVKLAGNLSINVVLYATSKKWGDIILKVLAPTIISVNEINYMMMSSNKFFAKCYYYNLEDKVMVLEKLTPGYPLSDINNQNERINIFCYIMNNITNDLIPKKEFKMLDDILKERFNLALNNKEYVYISDMINKAIKMHQEINSMNLPKYVLHDDLHHNNILKSKNDWKVIDPHGIVGEKVFETSQFIRSELSYCNLEDIDLIISKISKEIKEEKKLIYKALYVYLTSKIIYHIKVKHNENKIIKNIKICEIIETYL